MNKADIQSFAAKLSEEESVFICGPKFGDNHLRVYAHGGFLCGIPQNSRGKLQRFDADYVKFAGEWQASMCSIFGIRENEKRKKKDDPYYKFNKETAGKGDARYALFLRYRTELLHVLKNKFLPKDNTGELHTAGKERKQQTTIARGHRSFLKNKGVVICDFESCVPKRIYKTGSLDNTKKLARFDLLSFQFTMDDQAILSMIEYKCSREACTGETANLYTHAKDMSVCEAIGTAYKQEILRRFRSMCTFGLLQDPPADLIERLSILEASPEKLEIRKCFLFTDMEKTTVLELLQNANIPDLKSFYVLCCNDPTRVDLSGMQTFQDFEKSCK